MTSSEEAFNVLTSLDLFKKSLRKDGTTIDLKDFVSAYKSLVKYVNFIVLNSNYWIQK